jgi:hypothetical protein
MSSIAAALAAGGSPFGGGFYFWSILGIVEIIGLWMVFVKAGERGWKAIIPFYNLYILCKITGRPGWWVILAIIPIINLVWIVFSLLISLDLAKDFGKGGGFGVGLWLLGFIFYPILGFGAATYAPPQARPVYGTPYPLQPQQYGQPGAPPAAAQQYGQPGAPPAAPTAPPWAAAGTPPPWSGQQAPPAAPPAAPVGPPAASVPPPPPPPPPASVPPPPAAPPASPPAPAAQPAAAASPTPVPPAASPPTAAPPAQAPEAAPPATEPPPAPAPAPPAPPSDVAPPAPPSPPAPPKPEG